MNLKVVQIVSSLTKTKLVLPEENPLLKKTQLIFFLDRKV